MSKLSLPDALPYRAYILRVWPQTTASEVRLTLIDIRVQTQTYTFTSISDFLRHLQEEMPPPSTDQSCGGGVDHSG